MDRPKVREYELPKKISDLPMGPSFQSGHLTEVTSTMRTLKPIINQEKCVYCLRCFLVCPEGAIDKSEDIVEIDYDYCKGCGVCAKECKLDAIDMIGEVE